MCITNQAQCESNLKLLILLSFLSMGGISQLLDLGCGENVSKPRSEMFQNITMVKTT